MTNTQHLSLPFLTQTQAQKHITHNEALTILDDIIFLQIKSLTKSAPPQTVLPGDRYVVQGLASAPWVGQEGKIAVLREDGWRFYTPQKGWTLYDEETLSFLVFNGTGWITLCWQQNADCLGIKTTADSVNRLAVSSENTLFTHSGGDHRLKINKAGPQATASLLFQENFSGKAEIGLSGDNNLHFKVTFSSNIWKEALVIDQQTAQISFPAGIAPLTTKGDLLVQTETGLGKIAIANDGDLLSCDRTQSTGLKYIKPRAGSGPICAFQASTSLFMAQLGVSSLTTTTVTANRLYLCAFIPTFRKVFTQIGVRVTTALAGSCRLGIFQDNGGGKPTTLVQDFGTIDTGTIGFKTLTFSLELENTLYWLCAAFNSACGVLSPLNQPLIGFSSLGTTAQDTAVSGLYRAFTFGVLPTNETNQTYSLLSGTNAAPLFYLR